MAATESTKPTINISEPRTMSELIAIVLPLLAEREIYTIRGRRLVRRIDTESGPSARELPKQILANEIESCCHWVKDHGRGGTIRVRPPASLVTSILVLGEWPGIRPWPGPPAGRRRAASL
jgi:hypothetical protein